MSTPARLGLGFLAALISVLTFHQGMIALLWSLGIANFGPFPMRGVPPLGIPQIVNLCFWGGLYGALFGFLRPEITVPLWLAGLGLGVLAMLVGFFIVAPLKGNPIAGNWIAMSWVRSFLINGFWGIGVGVIYGLLPANRTAAA